MTSQTSEQILTIYIRPKSQEVKPNRQLNLAVNKYNMSIIFFLKNRTQNMVGSYFQTLI